MRRFLNFSIPFTCAILAFVLYNLGMDWINFGYGIHPALAFPTAALVIFLALLWHCLPSIE
jgi:hypothetical protein